MKLKSKKLETVRMILETDNKNILRDVKAPFKNRCVVKTPNKEANLDEFYEGFKDSIHEIKISMAGKVKLKDAQAWLNEN